MTTRQNIWMVVVVGTLLVAVMATVTTAQQASAQDVQVLPSHIALVSLQRSSDTDTAMNAMRPPAAGAELPCPWDCAAIRDGTVGIKDFLALLGEWGTIGSPCDFGGGPPGIGIEDFLELLANWGRCP